MSSDKRLHDKVDLIVDKINQIEISQARTEIIMDTHIKRTGLAEENIDILRKELKPIKSHVDFINNTCKLIAGLGAAAVILKTIGWWDKIIHFFLP